MDFARKMHELFLGLERAYGYYDVKGVEGKPGEKILGKRKTIQATVTDELWHAHLDGDIGIGIVPIDDKSQCHFGAIDIDVYEGLNYKAIVKDIYTKNIPIIPFRSKSGGLHLFMFTSEPIPASDMRERLGEIASMLGHGKAEIFPKQDQILAERGDIGGWINVPYQNHLETTRYAYNAKSDPLTLEEFIDIVETKRLSKKAFNEYQLPIAKEVADGPPCLQKMLVQGIGAGSRNDSMFNIAVYFKKAIGSEGLNNIIQEINAKYFDPKLSVQELVRIIESVNKKDYGYSCDRSPLKDHCNRSLCRQRRFGIGGLVGMPQLTGLTKFDSNPPIWFVDVEGGGRLELATEDLQSQNRFQRKCMDFLNTFPPPMKPQIWQGIVQELMQNVVLIEAPSHASTKGIMFEYLERFCTSRAQARSVDEILLGKPFTDSGKHHFRLLDFIDFLERNRFREFKPHVISSMIKDTGGVHKFIKIKGKGVNIWVIDEFASQTEKFETPDYDKKDII